MNVLFIGDVVGKGGRKALNSTLPHLRLQYNCTLCVANVENIAGGVGVTKQCVDNIKKNVEIMTTGDHVWDQKVFQDEISDIPFIIRPANFHSAQPGQGFYVLSHPEYGKIAVINLIGKVFMKDSAYCPFETVEKILSEVSGSVKFIIVDFHAEATSEKIAMGRFLDGKVSAVLGTHTHVQTADARILPRSTAYITDVGMTGGVESVLGRDIDPVIKKFRTGMPQKLPVVEKGIKIEGVVLELDDETGMGRSITPISVHTDI